MLRHALFALALVRVAVGATVEEHTAALSGPNALAEWKAFSALVEAGDQAVPALLKLATTDGPLQPRLMAMDALREIGTDSARRALMDILRTEHKDLAVRCQACIHLGALRERRAIPLLAAWLDTVGPRSLHDVRGPKEAQPSTCYLRHVEALSQICDPSAIPAIERFQKRMPKGVGYGGFLSNFVLRGVEGALANLRAKEVFLRRVSGKEGALKPLFSHVRTDPVSRYRLHEALIIRGGHEADMLLRVFAGNETADFANAARVLLAEEPKR